MALCLKNRNHVLWLAQYNIFRGNKTRLLTEKRYSTIKSTTMLYLMVDKLLVTYCILNCQHAIFSCCIQSWKDSWKWLLFMLETTRFLFVTNNWAHARELTVFYRNDITGYRTASSFIAYQGQLHKINLQRFVWRAPMYNPGLLFDIKESEFSCTPFSPFPLHCLLA